MIKKIAAFLILFAFACSNELTNPWDGFTPFSAQYDVDHLSVTPSFSAIGKSRGEVNLMEASGIVASRVNSQALWAHNDGGDSNYIYLLDETTAQIKATYLINGISNKDWEDIAVGAGEKAGEYYIYLADIGDNTSSREYVTVYVFPEPIFIESHRGKIINYFPKIEAIHLTYPDGSRDAETIMLDPATRDLYIVSKYGEHSILYVSQYPQLKDSIALLNQVGSFPFREVVAGDISSDGNEVLLKNYEKIFYWKNTSHLPLWKLLSSEPTRAPYDPVEAQGEAICFGTSGFFTLSEKWNGIEPDLYFYSRLE